MDRHVCFRDASAAAVTWKQHWLQSGEDLLLYLEDTCRPCTCRGREGYLLIQIVAGGKNERSSFRVTMTHPLYGDEGCLTRRPCPRNQHAAMCYARQELREALATEPLEKVTVVLVLRTVAKVVKIRILHKNTGYKCAGFSEYHESVERDNDNH